MTDTSRPLVTFALFSYNQEKYIREAVEGAFSQTYEPLEIILSDDCSTDRTFEIMQEMAAAYKGQHKLKLRRSPYNFGLAQHVNSVLADFSGQYLVLAAGDDISVPKRTSACVSTFLESNSTLVHSMVRYMDSSGEEIIVERNNQPLLWGAADLESGAKSLSLYIGATGAISRVMVNKFGPMEFKSAYEDLVFGFRSLIDGGSTFIPEALVKYRFGVSISNYNKKIPSAERVKRKYHGLKAHADVFRQRLQDLEGNCSHDGLAKSILLNKLIEVEFSIAIHEGPISMFRSFTRNPITISSKIYNKLHRKIISVLK
jgi:glycosyltransferase involved in cell wall biosynthesis